MAWCAASQLKSFGDCRFRFYYGIFPRCSFCPIFDAEPFHPLKLTKFARDLDDGKYACSCYENADDGAGAAEAAADGEGDASGAGLTSHF
jgi:hypothetical protein